MQTPKPTICMLIVHAYTIAILDYFVKVNTGIGFLATGD